MRILEPKDFALLAAEAAAEKKASDVVVLEVAPTLVITDYFVIATGENDRKVRAIAEECERVLKEAGLRTIGREGEQEGKWILLDFADVVVHVFQPDEREFYRLERLYSDAPQVELSPEVANRSAMSETEESAAPEADRS